MPQKQTISRWTLRSLALGVLALSVFSILGFAQDSKQGAPATDGVKKLPAAHLDGQYFTREGKRFLPVGAHWVPAKAAMQWPVEWDPKDIEADFAKMHELGYNITRLDLMWAWFEPRPGDYNPVAFQQLDYLLSLAHKYQIYLHPSLFIGGEVGEAYWDVPWRHGRHPHADPEMLRLETNLAAEFGRRYANETGIIAWDLTDEPPFWIVQGQTSDAMAINWTRLITGAIRREDKLHPIVIGTSGEEIGHGPFRPDTIVKDVDFFSVHPFTIYGPDLFPDPMLSERGTYGAAFEISVSRGAGKPSMIHEIGGSTAQYAPETVAAYDRLQMYSGIAAGSIGIDLWCYTDASLEQYHKAPYLRTPQETQWGMTTWDRQDKALATEFKKFSKVMGQLNLTGLAPAPAEIAILIPEEWSRTHGDFSRFGLTGPEVTPYVSTFDGDAMPGQAPPNTGADNQWLMSSALNTFILAHRAGMKADFPREQEDWTNRPMLFMPSPLTSTAAPIAHVHSDFYERAKKYVEGGGFLYASVAADAAIPNMEPLFGARLVDTVTASDVTLKFVEPFGGLKPGETFHFSVPGANPRTWGSKLDVKGGKVIAVDQDGRPALIANTVGKGKTLLCAYPIESYIASTPSAFEKTENTHRLYEAFRNWTGVKPAFVSNEPSVEVTSLRGEGRGLAFVVNHSAQPHKVTVTSAVAIKSAHQIGEDKAETLPLSGSGWTIDLKPYDAKVVEWQ